LTAFSLTAQQCDSGAFVPLQSTLSTVVDVSLLITVTHRLLPSLRSVMTFVCRTCYLYVYSVPVGFTASAEQNIL